MTVLLVAVGLSGVVAVAISTVMTSTDASRQQIELDLERMALAQEFLASTDCEATYAASACDTATGPIPVALYRKTTSGTVSMQIAKDGSKNRRGRLLVKAICDPADMAIKVKAVLATGKSTQFLSSAYADFVPEPLHKRVPDPKHEFALTWADGRSDLIKAGVPLCIPEKTNLYPKFVVCSSFPTVAKTPVSKVSYKLYAFYGKNAKNGAYNKIVGYQGPSSGTARISYKQATGAANYYTWSGCNPSSTLNPNFCAFANNGVYAYHTHVAGTTLACPLKLALDGRVVQE